MESELEVIETYREVLFEGRRVFELRPDSVHVVGRVFLQSDFELTVPLAQLRPDYQVLRERSRSFWNGLGIMLFGAIGAELLVEGFQFDRFGYVPVLLALAGLSGILLSLATVRKTEYAVFTSDPGLPVLTVGRSGPDRDRFDQFVGLLVSQIRKCRGPV
jgi:hypothetical protein